MQNTQKQVLTGLLLRISLAEFAARRRRTNCDLFVGKARRFFSFDSFDRKARPALPSGRVQAVEKPAQPEVSEGRKV